MYLIGSDVGIERKYVNPSRAFMDSLSLDMQSVMIYGLVGMVRAGLRTEIMVMTYMTTNTTAVIKRVFNT